MTDGTFELPHANSDEWPEARNQALYRLYPAILKMLKIKLYWFQAEQLIPPVPGRLRHLRYIQNGGGKRVGKSYFLGLAAAAYPFLPGAQVRLYGPQTENAEREFTHLANFLFNDPLALCNYYPFLKERLVEYNDEPSKGALVMKWDYGTKIRSHTWKERDAWLGEPIDLGIICEPGRFPDIRVYTKFTKPNLEDRNGLVRACGTVDNPWMFDMHGLCHHASIGHYSKTEYWREQCEPPTEPVEQFCTCQIPRWENKRLNIGPEMIEKLLDFNIDESAREIAINWLGMWEMYSDTAYEDWNPEKIIEVVPDEVWKRLKAGKAGWERYAALDTGKHNALGEYTVSPQGVVLRIDEFTNYKYQAGRIARFDTRGFRPWFRDICTNWQEHTRQDKAWERVIYGDPSSQFKDDVTSLGCAWVNAVNDHAVGVDRANEYFRNGKFKIIKPASSAHIKTNLEIEIPRARWHEKEQGIAGKPRLVRGDDHTSDECRYYLASNPMAAEYVKERPETIEQRDARLMDDPDWGESVDDQEGFYC